MVVSDTEQAYQREKKTFEKKLDKQEQALSKKLWHLHHQSFSCEADAFVAAQTLAKKYPCFSIALTTEAIEKHKTRGRPSQEAQKVITGYRLISHVERNTSAIEQVLYSKGRFILATNELDAHVYSDKQMLQEYKEQQSVERGFRFLKDPWFMVDSIFLKSPKRIEALMMTLCLLVYNVAQYQLRERLKENNDT
jgi:transposase